MPLSTWTHRHVLDLAAFSLDDYAMVLELAQRFRSMPTSGARKLPALQGRLVTTLFFEPSTRTRSSFELAARRLSADVVSFTPGSSSLSKGESLLDTVRTYVAMGAELLVVRHRATAVPQQLAEALDAAGDQVAVLNGGDGLHSHPSQGLLDLFSLARHLAPEAPGPDALRGRRIVIVGDVLHSRVARSNLWALTACGADVVLCGPPTLVPEAFAEFVSAPPPGQARDPIARLRAYMTKRKLWDDAKEAALKERVEKENAEAVARAEGIAAPDRADFFDTMYAEIPQDLAVQRDTMQTHSLGQDPSQLPPEAQERARRMQSEAAAAQH